MERHINVVGHIETAMCAERGLSQDLQYLQVLSIGGFLAIQLFTLLRESVGLLGALGVTLLVSLVLPQFIRFVRWIEAVIKITGGLSVKHVALLLLMMVSPFVFVFVCWLIENLVGVNREQVWFVIAIITSIPFLILDIRLLYRKTPEFFY
jgi:hypothetical protein